MAAAVLQSSSSDNNTSTLYLCSICQHPVDWEEMSVQCDSCEQWFHISCQGIPDNHYSKLRHSSVFWTCSCCNSKNQTIASPVHLLEDTTQLTETSMSNSSLEVSIDSINGYKPPMRTSSPTKFKPSTTKFERPLRIINVNCQSLSGKKAAWINLIHSTKSDVIIATETWLDSIVVSTELESDSYTIYRKDRQTGIHGGVLIAVNSAITSTEVNIQCDAEILWVRIQCVGHKDIYIAACYRPNESEKNFSTHLKKSLYQLMTH